MYFSGYTFVKDTDSFVYVLNADTSIIENIELSDGTFKGISMSTNIQEENIITQWDDSSTIMTTNFTMSCCANKSQIDISKIDGLVIKKRCVDINSDWGIIHIQPIKSDENFSFQFNDYICRNGYTYQYNILPIHNGIITEQNNIIQIKSDFD